MLVNERVTLETIVSSVAALLHLGVAWEGVEFDPHVGTSWLSASLIPSPNPNYSTIGAEKWIRSRNILQLNINTPDRQGSGPATLLADQIIPHFKGQIPISNSPVGAITFQPPPYFKPLGSRAGFYVGILSIPYQIDYPEQA